MKDIIQFGKPLQAIFLKQFVFVAIYIKIANLSAFLA